MSAKVPPKPAKPGKETIYVDVDDEITSIIDKVEDAKEKVVALVLPKRATSLQSIVNMRLLKRSADSASKNVVLITSEGALLPLAGAAGIHVAKNLQSKPEIPPSPKGDLPLPESPADELDEDEIDPKSAKLDYHRSIGELAATGLVDEPEAIALEDEDEIADKPAKKAKSPKIKGLKVPNFDRFRILLGLGALGLIGLIIFLILALSVLPKARITVQTSSTPVSADLTLATSDKAKVLDEANHSIPAVLKSSDQTATQQVQATGQQNNGDKASGTMVFYNCSTADTLSGTNRTVPAGTGVSANSLTFITTQAVTVQPSHFAGSNCLKDLPSSSVNVKAQNPGTKYNVDATTYSVAGFSTISGNGSKMTGGTDNNVTILSQQDVDKAKQKITSQDTDNFTKQFESQLSDQGGYVLTSTLKLSDPAITASPAVGQAASTSTVNIKITYSVLVVQKSDLQTAINDALDKQIDKKKEKISATDVLKNATVTVQNQTSPTNVSLAISIDTTAVPIIDVNSVKKQAEGQKAGDIKASLNNYPGVKNVDVKMSPFWVSHAPKNPGKITVILQQVKGGGQ